jgi:hypothetical protein
LHTAQEQSVILQNKPYSALLLMMQESKFEDSSPQWCDISSYPWRPESLITQLWKPQNSHWLLNMGHWLALFSWFIRPTHW